MCSMSRTEPASEARHAVPVSFFLELRHGRGLVPPWSTLALTPSAAPPRRPCPRVVCPTGVPWPPNARPGRGDALWGAARLVGGSVRGVSIVPRRPGPWAAVGGALGGPPDSPMVADAAAAHPKRRRMTPRSGHGSRSGAQVRRRCRRHDRLGAAWAPSAMRHSRERRGGHPAPSRT